MASSSSFSFNWGDARGRDITNDYSGFTWNQPSDSIFNNNLSSNWNFGSIVDINHIDWNLSEPNATPWHYNESTQTEHHEKETIVPGKLDREYLVFGYGRRCYKSSIPNDILSLCLNMYGLEGFSWNIHYEHLKQTHYYQSKIFCCTGIKFQIIIKQKEDSSTSGWTWDSLAAKRLHFHIKIMDPAVSGQKTVRIIAVSTIYCKQLQKRFHSMINSSFEMIKKDGDSVIEMLSSFTENDIKPFEFVEFYGNLNILHIDILDTTNNILSVYHVLATLNKRIEYEWTLNPSLSPHINTYCSPSFDGNNWCLIFEEPKSWGRHFCLRLQLLSLPPQINSMRVLCHCFAECNDISYTDAKVQLFGLNQLYSSDTFTWFLSDFDVKQSDAVLPAISFKISIEVIQAETRSYIDIISDPEADKTTFTWNNWGDSRSSGKRIPNKQLSMYGIRYEDDVTSNDNNYGRLSLQQQIQNVKQSKYRKQNDVNATDNNYSFWNDIKQSPLYIDVGNDGDEAKNVDQETHDSGFEWNTNVVEDVEQKQTLFRPLADIMEEVEDKRNDENHDISNGLQFDFGNVHNDSSNDDSKEYQWIESSLKTITPKYCVSVLETFKAHEVTDQRLCDLDSNDWKELIKQIGVRNEMQKLFKQKNSEAMILPSDSEL